MKGRLLFILLLVAPFVHKAQVPDGHKEAFIPGNNSFGIAIGFQPARVYDGLSYTAALVLNYDHVTVHRVGPGTLNMGAESGIYGGQPNNARMVGYWFKMGIAARGSYHLALLFNDRFDPYAGVAFGLYSAPEQESRRPYHTDRYKSDVFLAPFIGAKFNFTRDMGIWAEGGYDITNLKVGLNFNF